MGQRGATFLEVMICIGVITVLASSLILNVGSFLASQELVSSSLQLVADIRWLRQKTMNGGSGTISYALLFQHVKPYGYYITGNGKNIKTIHFPQSVELSGFYTPIYFSLSGAPVSGAQSIGLVSNKLKTWKYVIVAPVTGRVRMSDLAPSSL